MCVCTRLTCTTLGTTTAPCDGHWSNKQLYACALNLAQAVCSEVRSTLLHMHMCKQMCLDANLGIITIFEGYIYSRPEKWCMVYNRTQSLVATFLASRVRGTSSDWLHSRPCLVSIIFADLPSLHHPSFICIKLSNFRFTSY